MLKHRPGFLLSTQHRKQRLDGRLPTRQQRWLQISQREPKARSWGFQVGEEGAWSLEVGGRASPGFSQGQIAAVLFPQSTLPPGGTNGGRETLSEAGLPQVQREGLGGEG